MGLRDFFETHELRPNDRMGLVFTEAGLHVEAIRRERKAPSGGARPQPDRARSESAAPRGTANEAPRGDREGRRGAAPAAPPDRVREDASRSAASSAPPSLRMATPAPSVPADPPAANVPEQSTSRAPRWEPLDVLAARRSPEDGATEAPAQDAAAAQPAEGPHRVREIRRGSPLRSQGSRPPTPEEGSASGSEADVPRSEKPARAGNAERSEEERPPKPFQGRGLDLFGLRRRLGFGRADAIPTTEGTPEVVEARPRSAPVNDAPARQGAVASDGVDAARAASASSPSTAVGVADSEARAEAPARDASPVHDEDIGAVEAYLARPDAPAIVRAERVAEELGLAIARVDGALDRIAENSEHLSRIRAGAYMLRRRGAG